MLRETVALRLRNEELVVSLQEERDRAQTADRAKTRFLAAASHDLRQPTHALSLLISTLGILGQRGNVASQAARELADKAKSIVGNLSDLLNRLLDISRLDAGVVTVAREPISLARLFSGLEDEFAGAAASRGIEWRVVDSSLWVDSDPVLLKRILDNLISNALLYTEKGRVLLGCRRRGTSVEIQIWGPDGVQLFRSPRSDLPQSAVLGFSDVTVQGTSYRVYTVQTPVQTVQIAQDMSARNARARALALALARSRASAAAAAEVAPAEGPTTARPRPSPAPVERRLSMRVMSRSRSRSRRCCASLPSEPAPNTLAAPVAALPAAAVAAPAADADADADAAPPAG